MLLWVLMVNCQKKTWLVPISMRNILLAIAWRWQSGVYHGHLRPQLVLGFGDSYWSLQPLETSQKGIGILQCKAQNITFPTRKYPCTCSKQWGQSSFWPSVRRDQESQKKPEQVQFFVDSDSQRPRNREEGAEEKEGEDSQCLPLFSLALSVSRHWCILPPLSGKTKCIAFATCCFSRTCQKDNHQS